MIDTTSSIFEKNMSRPEALLFVENNAFEGYWIWDLVEKKMFVNRKLLQNLGYDPQEEPNLTIAKLLNLKGDFEKLNQSVKNLKNTIIFNYFTKNNGSIAYEVEILELKDFIDNTTGYIFANKKLSGVKETQEVQENFNNENFVQKLIFEELEQISNIGGWEINLKTGQVIWTKQVYKIHEVDDTFVPKADEALNFYVKEDREKVVKALQDALKKSLPFDLNCKIQTTKSNIKWVRLSGRVIMENEKPSKIVGVFQDITTKTIQSEKLRISENTFRGNFEHAAIGMVILDKDANWLEVNKKLCKIFGYNEEELKALTLKDITYPEDFSSDAEFLRELASGVRDNFQVNKRFFHKNGTLIHATLSTSVVRNSDGSPFHYISQILDITENVKAKQKLEEVATKMNAVFNASTQVSIVAVDINGVITNFNSGAENLLGYTSEEVINKKNIEFLHSPLEIEMRKAALNYENDDPSFNIFSNLTGRDFETREWIYVHKDGYEFPVLLTVTKIIENDSATGYLCVAIDLTEIKKFEREITSLLEITKDQNERLKNFAHIVSHNLRSHAANFKMLLDLLVHDHPEFKSNEFINYLETASDDLKETISHLNEVVQLNTTLIDNLEDINLHEVIEMNIRNVQLSANTKSVIIRNNIKKDTTIKGITAYLSSVIFNFLTNSIKYSNPNVKSFVNIRSAKNGEYLELFIEDNGIGINLQKNGAKLFGMYKTFHNNADARGIGLFITKNQVEAMGGKIDVESELGKGTTFKITLKT